MGGGRTFHHKCEQVYTTIDPLHCRFEYLWYSHGDDFWIACHWHLEWVSQFSICDSTWSVTFNLSLAHWCFFAQESPGVGTENLHIGVTFNLFVIELIWSFHMIHKLRPCYINIRGTDMIQCFNPNVDVHKDTLSKPNVEPCIPKDCLIGLFINNANQGEGRHAER